MVAPIALLKIFSYLLLVNFCITLRYEAPTRSRFSILGVFGKIFNVGWKKTTCNTLGFPSFQCMGHFHGQVMEVVVNKEGEEIGDKVITVTCTAS